MWGWHETTHTKHSAQCPAQSRFSPSPLLPPVHHTQWTPTMYQVTHQSIFNSEGAETTQPCAKAIPGLRGEKRWQWMGCSGIYDEWVLGLLLGVVCVHTRSIFADETFHTLQFKGQSQPSNTKRFLNAAPIHSPRLSLWFAILIRPYQQYDLQIWVNLLKASVSSL